MKRLLKKDSAITLIALIITIIILLILAGITIGQLKGNGIFESSKEAKEKYGSAKKKEEIELLLDSYKIDSVISGDTLEEYLDKNNRDYDKDDDGNIVIEDEGYTTTINPKTLEIDGPTKTDKNAKIRLSAKTVQPDDILTATFVFGTGVDTSNCKYKFVKTDVEIEKNEITDPITDLTINLPTTQKGEYYLYLLVAYKDGTESTLKKAKVTVGIVVKQITINKTSLTLKEGQDETLTATVLPENATTKTLDWVSSDTSIAKVDSTGKVTAIKVGTANIMAKSTDGSNIISDSCTVTVEEAITEVGDETHEPTTLTYTWEEMNELARKISLNYEQDDENNKITKDTEEVKIGKYKIGVGDTIAVGSYTARILGFNQDLLVDSDAYEDNETHSRAGISFEFVSPIYYSTMHGSSNGVNKASSIWTNSIIRSNLNNTTIDSLANKDYIKLVTKKYIPYHNTATTADCEDKLWLLACSEIWDNGYYDGYYGYAVTSESDGQYKYYQKNLGSTEHSTTNNILKKPNSTSPAGWWLRSKSFGNGGYDMVLCSNSGTCQQSNCNSNYAVCPAFCI